MRANLYQCSACEETAEIDSLKHTPRRARGGHRIVGPIMPYHAPSSAPIYGRAPTDAEACEGSGKPPITRLRRKEEYRRG